MSGDEHQMDPSQLNAETQRILRESATGDRIGRGHQPDIKPLSGVLEKIKSRNAAAVTRAPKVPAQFLAAQSAYGDGNSQEDGEEGDDLVVLSGDEDEDMPDADLAQLSELACPAAAPAPVPNPAPAMPAPHAAWPLWQDSLPCEDTQDVTDLPSRLDLPGPLPAPRLIPDSLALPSLHLTLDSESQGLNGQALQDGSMPESAALCLTLDSLPGPSELAPEASEGVLPAEPAKSETAAAPAAAFQPARPADSNRPAPPSPQKPAVANTPRDEEDELAALIAKRSGSFDEEEEEEEASEDLSGSSDGDSDDDDVSETEQERAAREAKEMALARELLVDKRADKRRTHYLEDEAEMSEDEGHSDDGEDEDVDEHGILEGLIGAEAEKRGDSKRRAALHAQWLEEQDEAQVQQIMDGIKNGFRRRRGPAGFLDDDQSGGSDWDARRRRALLAGGGDLESDEEQEGDDGDPEATPDDDAEGNDEHELETYHRQRVLEASQDAAASIALDAGSQEVLGLLAHCIAPAEPAPPARPTLPQRSRLGFGRELTNQRTGVASFMGRTSSSSQVAGASARAASQHGNTRSFVFGRDDSNSALNADAKAEEAQALPATAMDSTDIKAAINMKLSSTFGLVTRRQ
ncbi:hypothetical protein WJX72_004046 [[Myrmecia] bisecta]|uniref:DNA replication checkpoint mediator MRC1 domain-containing protein n=1 Tax=[Myrmecia] bisecta TaxID=41462 RepID=A0AAW1R656_9CHLO